MIEHRWHNRLPVRLKAELSIDGRMAAEGRVCNVSRAGLYVETGGLRLARGAMIDLRMSGLDSVTGPETTHRCLVIHSTCKGAGLLLVQDAAAFTAPTRPVAAA
jgi:hypothetical protein